MLTLEQKCKIAAWMQLLQSATAVLRRFRVLYGRHYKPDRNTILNTYRKFMKTGSVMDRPRSGKSRSGQSEENAAAVREAFDLSQAKFIRRASLE